MTSKRLTSGKWQSILAIVALVIDDRLSYNFLHCGLYLKNVTYLTASKTQVYMQFNLTGTCWPELYILRTSVMFEIWLK